MATRDKVIKVIQNAVDGCAEYWAGLIADELIKSGLVVDDLRKEIDLAVRKELKSVAIKYYPCFNRMQQKEIAHRCGISHQELEREFYKPYIEKHGHLPIIGDSDL